MGWEVVVWLECSHKMSRHRQSAFPQHVECVGERHLLTDLPECRVEVPGEAAAAAVPCINLFSLRKFFDFRNTVHSSLHC